ncbi:MAG: beta-lactamase family protein [Chitinophagaceae bacterium]|nr:beta-lactamase family protein [Chitinophagaceae bacterium]
MSFDFEKFANAIENGLKGNCVGYAFVVSYKDNWKVKRAGGYARTLINTPPLEMSTNVQFHTASVSKAITAVALLKVLNQRQDVSLDSLFYKFLPSHWRIHQSLKYKDNDKKINFQRLLTHKSGFRFDGGLDYHALKKDMAAGVNESNIGNNNDKNGYQGENFAIMRLLIPKLAGYSISQNEDGGPGIDILQAAEYADYYMDYVQKHLFEKAGLPLLKCKAEVMKTGMCYHFPHNNKPGTDFGNQTLVCGSKGWVMSAAELAKFFRTVHYTEAILPTWLSDKMKDELLGYGQKGETAESVGFYCKNGKFPRSQNDGELNTLIIGYANHVQVALIINSELTGNKGMVEIINAAHDEAYKMKKNNVDDLK